MNDLVTDRTERHGAGGLKRQRHLVMHDQEAHVPASFVRQYGALFWLIQKAWMERIMVTSAFPPIGFTR